MLKRECKTDFATKIISSEHPQPDDQKMGVENRAASVSRSALLIQCSQLQEIRIYPSSSTNLNLPLALRGTLCRVTAKNASNAEKSPECDCCDCGAYNDTRECLLLAGKLFPRHPALLHGRILGRSVILGHEIFGLALVGDGVMEVPGRGLEPLRIAPPDPKSGASANFATPANCDGHERRFVGCFEQIALVSFLRFLRQME